ncbi:uncharacterized protein BDZ83DRAFT_124855 [Colletotrichum acutatum]|uniref:Uncharacterized protein n=1 Tax=Glomerella acutata TaxID=27357 RepID=A0AAD8UA43_GLOAC|nr:uncharacterized protein BDZ83DRAFT_124855 [Colletotrichum acutatum]KAK1710579.1 hypothetical protein BDZ83DRAFT_124855 [Colletotrichum acutatum]
MFRLLQQLHINNSPRSVISACIEDAAKFENKLIMLKIEHMASHALVPIYVPQLYFNSAQDLIYALAHERFFVIGLTADRQYWEVAAPPESLQILLLKNVHFEMNLQYELFVPHPADSLELGHDRAVMLARARFIRGTFQSVATEQVPALTSFLERRSQCLATPMKWAMLAYRLWVRTPKPKAHSFEPAHPGCEQGSSLDTRCRFYGVLALCRKLLDSSMIAIPILEKNVYLSLQNRALVPLYEDLSELHCCSLLHIILESVGGANLDQASFNHFDSAVPYPMNLLLCGTVQEHLDLGGIDVATAAIEASYDIPGVEDLRYLHILPLRILEGLPGSLISQMSPRDTTILIPYLEQTSSCSNKPNQTDDVAGLSAGLVVEGVGCRLRSGFCTWLRSPDGTAFREKLHLNLRGPQTGLQFFWSFFALLGVARHLDPVAVEDHTNEVMLTAFEDIMTDGSADTRLSLLEKMIHPMRLALRRLPNQELLVSHWTYLEKTQTWTLGKSSPNSLITQYFLQRMHSLFESDVEISHAEAVRSAGYKMSTVNDLLRSITS